MSGSGQVGVTLPLLPVTLSPEQLGKAVVMVEEEMPVPLATNATLAVPSLMKRRPAGNWSRNWKLVDVPSGTWTASR